MKYYIIAGEASGDLHAANLMHELKKADPQADFRCWGGDMMQAEGGEIVKHYRELAFMGFIEVIANLRTILRNIDYCKSDIKNYQPDALVLIDYPGFNLRIAEFGRKQGLKVIYYISPQIWAWKQSRVKAIKRDVDRMMVILPFEKDFYRKSGFDVSFVGHPLLDAIAKNEQIKSEFRKLHGLDDKKIIALLPGSRKQEITTMLPLMLKAIEKHEDYHCIIAGAPSIPKEFYEEFIDDKAVIIYGETYEILRNSYAALVTSGTATLETALFEVPQVVCYKGNMLSYLIARQLIKVDFISLVNLVMEKEIVKELIQNELTVENLRSELDRITKNTSVRNSMLQSYKELKSRLGGTGASQRAAALVIKEVNASGNLNQPG